jgi:hypothetical protein
LAEEFSSKCPGKVKHAGWAAHEHHKMAKRDGGRSIPTRTFFKQGKEGGRLVGSAKKGELTEEVKGCSIG